ncbi:MAG: hypothetical protein AAF138_08825 [Planctomycetota bacterium]
MTMTVSRCVCFNTTFEELWQELCRGRSLAEVHLSSGCGAKCGLCVPYIRLMAQTGQTEFPVLWTEDFRVRGVNPSPMDRVESRVQRRHDEAPSMQQSGADAEHDRPSNDRGP